MDLKFPLKVIFPPETMTEERLRKWSMAGGEMDIICVEDDAYENGRVLYKKDVRAMFAEKDHANGKP